jgi:hypothetical protein
VDEGDQRSRVRGIGNGSAGGQVHGMTAAGRTPGSLDQA